MLVKVAEALGWEGVWVRLIRSNVIRWAPSGRGYAAAPPAWAAGLERAVALLETCRHLPYIVLRLATLAPGALRENNEQ